MKTNKTNRAFLAEARAWIWPVMLGAMIVREAVVGRWRLLGLYRAIVSVPCYGSSEEFTTVSRRDIWSNRGIVSQKCAVSQLRFFGMHTDGVVVAGWKVYRADDPRLKSLPRMRQTLH